MKHKIIYSFLVGVITILTILNFIPRKSESLEDDTSKPKQIVKENTLSMMIEQTAGAGDYKMETRTSWPTDGYTFNATLSKCENGGELGWDSEKGVVTMTGNMSDKCYIYFDKILTLADYCSSGQTLSSCIIATADFDDTLYHHDGSLTNGINDGSYRYAGASSSVNNYVCFGSDEDTCPTDNLYRIIGVFGDQVKLIKADYATSALLGTDGDYYGSYTYGNSTYLGSNYANIASYYWNYKNDTSINNGDGSNTWSTSLLNTVNLNTNFIAYLNNINRKWANMIAKTTWKVGGNTWANIGGVVPATAYSNEIPNAVSTNTTDNATTYSDEIGLMYVSDYGFAASSSAWSTALSSYNSSSITSVNWMYMGLYEWTISRCADYSDLSFPVHPVGYLPLGSLDHANAVRPVFYLASTATYSSGDGTSNSPIRLG